MKKNILLLFIGLSFAQQLMLAKAEIKLSSDAKFACAWSLGATAWAAFSVYSHYSNFLNAHPSATFSEYVAELSNDVYQNKGAIAKRAALVLGVAGLGHGLMYYNRSRGAQQPENGEPKEKPGVLSGNPYGVAQVSGRTTLMVPRKEMFKKVFGVSEQEFQKDYSVLDPQFDENGFLFVTPKKGFFAGKKIACGKFTQLSIEQLCEETADIKGEKPGFFSVLVGEAADLQAKQEYRDTVFQAASNMSALETTSPDQVIEDQPLDWYLSDLTQGPAVSVSAFGGTLLRRYFAFYSKDTDQSLWQQTSKKNVNFLDGIKDKVAVSKAGYVVFKNSLQMPTKEDYKKIAIGFHENVQVVAGTTLGSPGSLQQEMIHDDQQIVSQVFTAAADLAGANSRFKKTEAGKAWAQCILNAAYEGTIRAAARAGKKQVFLTLVGGGVFENSFESIGNAIVRMKDFIVDSGLEVTVALYGQAKSREEANLRTRLQALAAETQKK